MEAYDSGRVVNWSELARQYEVKDGNGNLARNGGQTIKEWLKKQGVDVDRFKRKCETDVGRTQKKKRRTVGGEITVPVDVTPAKLKNMIHVKINECKYTIGNRIVPKSVSIYN